MVVLFFPQKGMSERTPKNEHSTYYCSPSPTQILQADILFHSPAPCTAIIISSIFKFFASPSSKRIFNG